MSERDPYQVLGIGPGATGADIARAYRRLARAVHPDSRPNDPAAAGQFRALSEAYGLLSDPARRAAWDHRHPPRPAPRSAPPRAAAAAGPALWPFPPALQVWPASRPPVHGAALSAGPVHTQPAAPEGTSQHARPADDPALARLLAWILSPGPEWPW
jgi:curved DNA-binding protein CbpA